MLRAKLVFVVALSLAATVTRGEVLKKLSLDDASSVSPNIETDANVKVEGASSLKITTRGLLQFVWAK